METEKIKACHECFKILTLDHFRLRPSGLMKTCKECVDKKPHKRPVSDVPKPRKVSKPKRFDILVLNRWENYTKLKDRPPTVRDDGTTMKRCSKCHYDREDTDFENKKLMKTPNNCCVFCVNKIKERNLNKKA
jgi:hypothetical protein